MAETQTGQARPTADDYDDVDYDVTGRAVHNVCENSDPCTGIAPAAATARAVLREEPTP